MSSIRWRRSGNGIWYEYFIVFCSFSVLLLDYRRVIYERVEFLWRGFVSSLITKMGDELFEVESFTYLFWTRSLESFLIEYVKKKLVAGTVLFIIFISVVATRSNDANLCLQLTYRIMSWVIIFFLILFFFHFLMGDSTEMLMTFFKKILAAIFEIFEAFSPLKKKSFWHYHGQNLWINYC